METLKEVLARYGFNFKKSFGQNFLTDAGLLASIVKGADCAGETVLEIGAGAGALTCELAKEAKRVISFEIDRSLQPILGEILSDKKNVSLYFEDILKRKTEAIESLIGEDYLVVANLPYYITTPLIMRFVEESTRCKRLVVMVQEEVADRLVAREGTPAYGAVTVAVNVAGRAEKLRRVPRELFTPRPNVDSAVVRIEIDRGRFRVSDRALLRAAVRAGFNNRRKTLCNNLMQSFSLSRAEAEALLVDCGIDLKARGETLSAAAYVELAERLAKKSVDSSAFAAR